MTLRIARPRARVSRSENRARPFSALGELLWYLAGSDEAAFVSPYIPFYGKKGKPPIVNGAYGPRIRSRHGFDQLDKVIEMMGRKDGSRRAVIQLYGAADLLTDDDVPCTLGLQFHRRGCVLHMTAMMRSNDAYLGLPHDVFCFTMIQELVAVALGLELGEYTHMVGSMHLYEQHRHEAANYIGEGYQRAAEMPPMPQSEPFTMIDKLLSFERKARVNEDADPDEEMGQDYWADLARLLQINFAQDDKEVVGISSRMRNNFYHSFIEDRRDRKFEAARQAAAKAGLEQAD